MGDAGILTSDDLVELIEGEILERTPISSRHAACVTRLDDGAVVTVTTTPLEGSLEASTATAGPVKFPFGFTRLMVSASWDPQGAK